MSIWCYQQLATTAVYKSLPIYSSRRRPNYYTINTYTIYNLHATSYPFTIAGRYTVYHLSVPFTYTSTYTICVTWNGNSTVWWRSSRTPWSGGRAAVEASGWTLCNRRCASGTDRNTSAGSATPTCWPRPSNIWSTRTEWAWVVAKVETRVHDVLTIILLFVMCMIYRHTA